MFTILEQINKALKDIHYPLCRLEKYVFNHENDEVNEQVGNIHKGYMIIQRAIDRLKFLNEVNNEIIKGL